MLGVVVKQLWREISQRVGGRDRVSGYGGFLKHRANEFFTVNRHGQRLAHASIIDRRSFGVDQVVIRPEVGSLHVGRVGHIAVKRDLVERYDLRVVQLLNAEHALFTHHIFHGVEDHGVQRHFVTVPVVLAFFHDDTAVKRPFGQRKRPVADDIADPSPGRVAIRHLTKLHECLRVHRERAVVVHQLHKIGRRRV